MSPIQSRMARAALQWSLSELASAASVGRATLARFELGEPVKETSVAKVKRALTDAGVQFTRDGMRIGVTVIEGA